MRKMVKDNMTLVVVEHIMTTNMWEYYIMANEPDTHSPDPDIVFALVMGDYDEMGSVSLSEIEPHILSRTTHVNSIAPAAGWRWSDEVAQLSQPSGAG